MINPSLYGTDKSSHSRDYNADVLCPGTEVWEHDYKYYPVGNDVALADLLDSVFEGECGPLHGPHAQSHSEALKEFTELVMDSALTNSNLTLDTLPDEIDTITRGYIDRNGQFATRQEDI